MSEFEILSDPTEPLEAIESRLISVIREVGLQVSLRTTLARYPGCVHWHVKKPNESCPLDKRSRTIYRTTYLMMNGYRSLTAFDFAIDLSLPEKIRAK